MAHTLWLCGLPQGTDTVHLLPSGSLYPDAAGSVAPGSGAYRWLLWKRFGELFSTLVSTGLVNSGAFLLSLHGACTAARPPIRDPALAWFTLQALFSQSSTAALLAKRAVPGPRHTVVPISLLPDLLPTTLDGPANFYFDQALLSIVAKLATQAPARLVSAAEEHRKRLADAGRLPAAQQQDPQSLEAIYLAACTATETGARSLTDHVMQANAAAVDNLITVLPIASRLSFTATFDKIPAADLKPIALETFAKLVLQSSSVAVSGTRKKIKEKKKKIFFISISTSDSYQNIMGVYFHAGMAALGNAVAKNSGDNPALAARFVDLASYRLTAPLLRHQDLAKTWLNSLLVSNTTRNLVLSLEIGRLVGLIFLYGLPLGASSTFIMRILVSLLPFPPGVALRCAAAGALTVLDREEGIDRLSRWNLVELAAGAIHVLPDWAGGDVLRQSAPAEVRAKVEAFAAAEAQGSIRRRPAEFLVPIATPTAAAVAQECAAPRGSSAALSLCAAWLNLSSSSVSSSVGASYVSSGVSGELMEVVASTVARLTAAELAHAIHALVRFALQEVRASAGQQRSAAGSGLARMVFTQRLVPLELVVLSLADALGGPLTAAAPAKPAEDFRVAEADGAA